MKPIRFLYLVLLVLLSSFASGCLSVASSPVPRFYTLRSTDNLANNASKFNIDPGLIIGVGPVEIPVYQNRPQIVTRNKDGMLTFAQFERWGEALDSGLERLILENLAAMLPQAEFQIFPCNFDIPLDYQVIISVIRLESQLDAEMFLSVQWTLVDSKTKEMLLTKRSQIRQAINPHTYSGLAQTLSKVCSLLSIEIAEKLSELSVKSKAKHLMAQ
jgi:uncharacterized lipoprotein YmbA